MTKLLLIGDVHLSDRPPSLRTDSYASDILAKLKQAGQIAKYNDCQAIVQAGDMFHIKAPSRTSHALVQRTAEVLLSSGLPVIIVPGNHDMSNDRLESLQKQPLGTLAKIEGITLLTGAHPTLPLFGLPFLANWADFPDWAARYRSWADEHKGEDFSWHPLMVTHAPLFPPGKEPPYDYISAVDWAEEMQNGDCYYGHIHEPHGVYEPASGTSVMFCNNGAISRGSLAEESLAREPAVTVWDSMVQGQGRFQRIALSVRPAEDVFRLHEKESLDAKQMGAEEFLEHVGSMSLSAMSLEEVKRQAQIRKLSPRTLALVDELLEGV